MVIDYILGKIEVGDMKINKMPFGGDYNPEQWTPYIWQEDMRLLTKAHVDVVTLNVFNWAMLQPDEETYDFSALDETVRRVTEAGMNIVMATATAAMPAWMARKHPDILRTEWSGMRRKFGGRHNCCPNSPTMHKYSPALVERLAERYKNQSNIIAWHISNEYSGRCYCENCEKAFRVWLQNKYGTLDMLNEQWCTNFWGHTFYDWEDIVAPNELSEEFGENWWNARTTFQGMSLDYSRFSSDSMLNNYRAEVEAIRKYIPDAKVTTNLMGTCKDLDYQKWAKYMDFASQDNYPSDDEPISVTAMKLDLIRSLKQGQPYWLMEQTPSVSNWLLNCSVKRPGAMRLLSYQAIAHGADSCMFFQMRRSIGACEKYHGAIIDHVGHENTRVFREVETLGAELELLGDQIIGARAPKKAAIIFDWDNWWAVEYSAGPSGRLKYLDEMNKYYEALHRLNISTDLVAVDDDISEYEVVFAPLLYMLKPGVKEHISEYVDEGGKLVLSFFSGYANENDRVVIGGYPGELKDLTGVWVEEIDALPEDKYNHFNYKGKEYKAGLVCDVVHALDNTEVLATLEDDFYAGSPAVTRNTSTGKGCTYYIGTSPEVSFIMQLCRDLGLVTGEAEQTNVQTVGFDVDCTDLLPSRYVECVVRQKDDCRFTFVLNHNASVSEYICPVDGVEMLTGQEYKIGQKLTLDGYGVMIFKENITNC